MPNLCLYNSPMISNSKNQARHLLLTTVLDFKNLLIHMIVEICVQKHINVTGRIDQPKARKHAKDYISKNQKALRNRKWNIFKFIQLINL